ncbi:MAG: ABC transporter ATP-binding protein [Lachnospiraceae bacterium]|nr:ABC transporter ATP-binding protein [Lachnospiraceae bacterium]MBR4781266.1 ABC transporter ATP-binding protein [Lachnospiraceae bacterium]MBR6474859.1 ABC transporter ATP-binding protein [Lachnospiraceae bacterium]
MKEQILLENINKEYMDGRNVLNNINLQFEKGKFVAVLGESGCGKTTLLNIISGIDRPSGGKIMFNELELSTMSQKELTRWRGKNIGIVFQFFQLIPTLTVLENVMLPMEFNHVYDKETRRKKALELLEKVNIAECGDKMPQSISGGEQQRTAIARALALDPDFIIADEPTGNLDSKNAEIIISLFRKLVKEGKTVIMVTHSEELAGYTDRIIRMKDGKIQENE